MKTKAFLIGFEDIVFWIITAILVFTTAYFSSEGEVRLYFLFGAMVGVIIYYWIFSSLVIQILTFLVKTVLWPFAFLIRVLKPPVKWLCKLIGQGTQKTRSKLHLAGIRMNRRFKSIRHIMRKV